MGFLFGGDSASTTKNINTDARVVGGDSSTNQSTVLNGDGNSLVMTDAGAVKQSLSLALAGITQANANSAQALASSGGLLADVLHTQGAQQKQFTDVVENIKTADVRILVMVGLAVVGLAFVRTRQKA